MGEDENRRPPVDGIGGDPVEEPVVTPDELAFMRNVFSRERSSVWQDDVRKCILALRDISLDMRPGYKEWFPHQVKAIILGMLEWLGAEPSRSVSLATRNIDEDTHFKLIAELEDLVDKLDEAVSEDKDMELIQRQVFSLFRDSLGRI